jgi:membrane protein implicated in regulation of membrane protease activity
MAHPWLLALENGLEHALSVYVNFFLYTLVAVWLHGPGFSTIVAGVFDLMAQRPFLAFVVLAALSALLERRLTQHHRREALRKDENEV